jgi:hypothetical protein
MSFFNPFGSTTVIAAPGMVPPDHLRRADHNAHRYVIEWVEAHQLSDRVSYHRDDEGNYHITFHREPADKPGRWEHVATVNRIDNRDKVFAALDAAGIV